MTENEIVKQAIRCIVGACDETCKGYDANESVCHGYSEVASGLETVLKDYEQYRAIGTVERFEQLSKQFAPHNVEETSCHLRQCNKCDMYRKENEKYHEIGTIDEFKALKEKNEPKKILYRKQSYGTPWLCPYCEADQIKVEFFSEDGSEPKEKYTFCWQCGTRIDWSE